MIKTPQQYLQESVDLACKEKDYSVDVLFSDKQVIYSAIQQAQKDMFNDTMESISDMFRKSVVEYINGLCDLLKNRKI